MLTLTDIKTYLRIDDNDNDDLLIVLKNAAQAQMRNIITDFDKKYENSSNSKKPDFVKISDLCATVIVANLYDKRVGDGSQESNYNFIIQNMLNILEYYSNDDISDGENNG